MDAMGAVTHTTTTSSAAAATWRHDVWNLLALGCLNAVHILWWLGLLSESALFAVFSLDVAYIALDGLWLVASPSCVPRRVWATLVAHHAAVLLCVPVAVGNPLLMRHLLRTWVVELHSWNHIAARPPWPLWARWAARPTVGTKKAPLALKSIRMHGPGRVSDVGSRR